MALDEALEPAAASESDTVAEPTGTTDPLRRLEALDSRITATPTSTAKTSRWDRPKPPRDWRFWVGGLGRVLISLGLLMFGFVAYQLWGTGIQTAAKQNEFKDQFEQLVSDNTGPPATVAVTKPPATDPPTSDPITTDPVTTDPAGPDQLQPTLQPPPEPEPGGLLAQISIPRIDLSFYVVSGVTVQDLKGAVGHFRESVLPGQLGNSAYAGHRTTYGEPFGDVDQLKPGDEIVLNTLDGNVFTYRVTSTIIVAPTDYGLVVPTVDPGKASITLISCNPKFSTRERIVVRGDLVVEESDGIVVPTERPLPEVDPEDPLAVPTPDQGGVDAEPVADGDNGADVFTAGWFSDKGAPPQVALWGLIVTAIAIGAWLLSRAVRRNIVGALVGIAPFVVALYFFFQNVNRLLPPGL